MTTTSRPNRKKKTSETQPSEKNKSSEVSPPTLLQIELLKTLATTLKSQEFDSLMENLKFRIMNEWAKAKELDQRENLHHELKALERLRKRVNALHQENLREE